ncbi:MAG: ADP-ribosylation factor-like protein [Candidatus Heimdallarchaeaceae archaeon]
MSNKINQILLSIRRRLGKPEVSILIMGNDTPAARNRVKLLNAEISIDNFLLDDYLSKLPVEDKFKFKPKLFESFEGILYLIDATKEDMIKHERAFFWERIIWNEDLREKPIAICAYNSNLQGSLTSGELIENLSLVRLTDRVWKLFEVGDVNDLLSALNWLREAIWMGWTLDWERKESLKTKLSQKKIVIVDKKNDNES